MSALNVIIQNHKSSLEVCKALIKEGRLESAQVILNLSEININNLLQERGYQ